MAVTNQLPSSTPAAAKMGEEAPPQEIAAAATEMVAEAKPSSPAAAAPAPEIGREEEAPPPAISTAAETVAEAKISSPAAAAPAPEISLEEEEAPPPAISAAAEMVVEGISFPVAVASLGSSKALFLAGAGTRGLHVDGGKYIKFTAIGVYLEKEAAATSLAANWKGKTAGELAASSGFYRDIYSDSTFEKLTRVTMILPLSGKQYSEKVAENCLRSWRESAGGTDIDEAAVAAVEKFKEVFLPETFPPGSSIFFGHSPSGELKIGFDNKVGGVAAAASEVAAVIESRALSEAILESIIGEHGVSPETKMSLAARMAEVLKKEA